MCAVLKVNLIVKNYRLTMSIQYRKMCSIIIKRQFDETVQTVVESLFYSYAKTLPMLKRDTGLSNFQVQFSLALLIKFRLVKFQLCSFNENIPEYLLERDNILLLIRYSKCVYFMKRKYGDIAASILEEVLKSGREVASTIITNCVSDEDEISVIYDIFLKMVEDKYIMRAPTLCCNDGNGFIPKYIEEIEKIFLPPDIDLKHLHDLVSCNVNEAKDNNIFWQVNFERFSQDFRDDILISAVERKLGLNAAECFEFLLNLMYSVSDPWRTCNSNEISYKDIKNKITKSSKNKELMKYLDQYVNIIADDSMNFVRKVGDNNNGQYIVQMKMALEHLATAVIEHIIAEKYGSKASRIFRVIKSKNYTEQEDIEMEAMIPAKEAKLLTYKLYEEQLIQIKTIRKPGGGGSGPVKAFYLFYIDLHRVTATVLDICYKALLNAIKRSMHEKSKNKRLIDKFKKLHSVMLSMREQGEDEDYINEISEALTQQERETLFKITGHIQTLSNAEINIEETIYLLQLYQYYIFKTT